MKFLYIPEIFGLSIEVYAIGIIIGMPVFFFWRWLLKKRKMTNAGRRIATWVATLLSTPVIYVSIVALFVYIAYYYPTRDFNRAGWMKNKDKRYEYSEKIIKSKMLIGKTKNEVRRILGADGELKNKNIWKYNLGYEPDSSLDRDWLYVDFNNGHVVKVVLRVE